MSKSEKINRNINDLHPLMRVAVNKFEGDLLYLDLLATGGKAGFKLFEGYRSPQRQDELLRTQPKVTKAAGWQSAHQFGLAVDYVWWHPEGGWTWDENVVPWDLLDMAVRSQERLVRPITWDRPHVQHTAFEHMKLRMRG